MVSIKEVLLKVSECRTLSALSKELDMWEATLRAILEFMVEKGYLEEFEGGAGCAGCSLKRNCNLMPPGEQRLKMYALTKEGREYIEET